MLGLIPIILVTDRIAVLLKDYTFLPNTLDINIIELPLFNRIRLHYQDLSIDPTLLEVTRQGRLGIAFFAMSLVSIIEGSKLFIPKRVSKRERELELRRDEDAGKTKTWDIVTWKRSNLILCSFFMGLLSVIIVEWSYWASFGKYIWEAIIFLKVVDNVVGCIIDINGSCSRYRGIISK